VGRTGDQPPEVRLVKELRAGPDWLEGLSLVAVADSEVVGHVCCSRGRLDGVVPASRLGIQAPDESWGDHFQARVLLASATSMSGRFSYAEAFDRV